MYISRILNKYYIIFHILFNQVNPVYNGRKVYYYFNSWYRKLSHATSINLMAWLVSIVGDFYLFTPKQLNFVSVCTFYTKLLTDYTVQLTSSVTAPDTS
jgi:hypothetical protein